jgi:hypothetical protein
MHRPEDGYDATVLRLGMIAGRLGCGSRQEKESIMKTLGDWPGD